MGDKERPVSPVNGQPLPEGHPPWKAGDEARENGRRGGIKSGETRRAKKVAQRVLSYKPDLPEETLRTMRRMGMKGKAPPDMREISLLAIMQSAMKGDWRAFKYIVDLAGESDESQMYIAQTERLRRQNDIASGVFADTVYANMVSIASLINNPEPDIDIEDASKPAEGSDDA